MYNIRTTARGCFCLLLIYTNIMPMWQECITIHERLDPRTSVTLTRYSNNIQGDIDIL